MKEANLLYDHKKYARAYHIAQAALEEFGKLNKLYAQVLRLYNKENINWEKLAESIKNSIIDDDVIFGIVLIVEKDYINYPPKIAALLHQPKTILAEDYAVFKESILDDALLVDIVGVYKSLNTPRYLKNLSLDKK